MTTDTQARKPTLSALHDPAALAIAVLVDRVSNLPEEDRNDLFELTQALFSSKTTEERDSAGAAMTEILEQAPVAVRKAVFPEEPGTGLQKWIDHVRERIRDLRKTKNLTQEQLAEKSGLPQSHISRLESGKHSPSFKTLEKIAAALEVDVSELDPSARE